MSEAFEKVGYIGPRLTATRTRRIKRALRDEIIAQVVATDPSRITVIQNDGHFRPRLRVLGLLVTVFVCRCSQNGENEPRWILNPVHGERNRIALIVLLNPGNKSVMDLFIVPDTAPQTRYTLRIDDPWLRRGKQLGSIGNFLPVVRLINVQRKSHNTS
ncbi:MAG: hypothetical protein WCC22_00450 [Terriglobales bacterium]